MNLSEKDKEHLPWMAMFGFLVIVLLIARCCRADELDPFQFINFERIDIEMTQHIPTECEFPDNEYSMNVVEEKEFGKIKERRIVDTIDGPIVFDATKHEDYYIQVIPDELCTLHTTIKVSEHIDPVYEKEQSDAPIIETKPSIEPKKACIEPCVDPVIEPTQEPKQEPEIKVSPIKIPDTLKVDSGCVASSGDTIFFLLLVFIVFVGRWL